MERKRYGEGYDLGNSLTKVRRDGYSLVIYPGQKDEIKIRDYYKEFDPNTLKGPLYSSNGPHAIRDQEELSRIISDATSAAFDKKKEYACDLSEPELSKVVLMEQRAMILEGIDLKYSAMSEYNSIARHIFNSRKNFGIGAQFSERAYNICMEWKKTGIPEPYLGMGESANLEGDIYYMRTVLKLLSKVDKNDMKKINEEFVKYDKYKVYPSQMKVFLMQDSTEFIETIETNPDKIKASYDRVYDSVLDNEYLALAQEYLAASRKERWRLLNATTLHLACANEAITHGFVEMAGAALSNAEKAFKRWEPSELEGEREMGRQIQKLVNEVRLRLSMRK